MHAQHLLEFCILHNFILLVNRLRIILLASKVELLVRFKCIIIIAKLRVFLLAANDWHKFNLERQPQIKRLLNRFRLVLTRIQTLTDTFIFIYR